ncbi:hypothetical protein ACR79M_15105 [Sphingobacterium spiritivorum]|uniref:hypothetical protein n=1 Tax=Sphingobacterium spiritivorum TaxID=258 RepID=UPI003DA64840
MKKYILSFLILFCSITGFAQTQPNKPAGAVPYGSVWITPNGHVWTGSAIVGYTNLGNKNYVDALVALGYTKSQVDAIVQAAKEFSTNRGNHTGTQEIETVANLPESLASKISLTEKGVSNGVSTLDPNGKIPLLQIPDALIGSVNYQGNWNPETNTPALTNTPGAATKGHYYIASVTGSFNGIEYNNGDWIISNGSVWGKVDNTNKVVSVNGKQGSVVLSLTDFAGGSDLVTLSTAQNITAKKTFKTAHATSGNGIAPIEVIGGNGAQIIATSGFAAAGNAAPINITSGNGGFSNGVNPSGTNSGGSGGEINIVAGNAGPAIGAANNINGFGGNVILQAGTSYGNGKPGNVQIKAGNNETGIGGDIFLTTGYGQNGPNDDATAGNIYMAVTASENSRGHVVVGGLPSDNNGNKFQVYGKASVSQAPTAPTDVVRLSDLGVKANSDGSNSSGTWPIAISGNAPLWGGQQYSSDEVPINNYILAYGADGKWHPSNKERFNIFLGSPSGGETLQSVTDRNSVTNNSVTLNGNNVGIYLGNIGNNASILYNADGNLDIKPRSGYNIRMLDGNVGIGTLSPTAKLHVNGDALASNLMINNSPGTYRELQYRTNGVLRWDLFASPTAESGGNVGSDFAVTRYADDGSYLGQPFSIARSTGNATFGNNLDVSGSLTASGTIRSNQSFSSYASVNSNASYRPTGITFNPAANTYATIDANTSGGLTIRTADGSATAQIRMTFLTPNGATARSVMLSGRAYYGSDYSGAFESNDLIPKKYVDDKIQLMTLRATISGGVAVLDGGAVQSGFRYLVQGASLYNGTTPEFLSLSKLAIQAGTSGNVAVQYETTSVDNGKDVEVLILKIKQ